MDKDSLPTALRNQLDQVHAALAAANTGAPVASTVAPEHGAPVFAPAPQAQQAPAPTVIASPLTGRSDDWEQRYRALQGKYNAEVPRLAADIRALQDQIAQMRQATPATVGHTQPTAAATPGSPVSDDFIRANIPEGLVDEYGMDYWRAHFGAMAALQPAGNASDERIAQIEADFATQKRDEFYASLDRLRPDWREVNRSAEWGNALDLVERLSGRTYEHLLKDAFDQHDAGRVADLMNTLIPATAPNQRPSIESQVMPTGRVAASGPVTSTGIDHATWSRQMVELAQSGQPTDVIQAKRKQLTDMLQAGLVTTGNGQQAAASFV